MAIFGLWVDRRSTNRILVRVLAAIIFLALWPAPTAAGGSSASAHVTDYTKVSNTVTAFTVKFTEQFFGLEIGAIKGCAEIKVWAKYSPGWWFWRRNWAKYGPHPVTRETYADALVALQRAYVEKKAIRFGTMGTGLRARATRCGFDARGLAIRVEYGGTSAVYAFHDSY